MSEMPERGDRIRLIRMDDELVPPGTKGVVTYVDEYPPEVVTARWRAGVQWNDGSMVMLLDIDEWERVGERKFEGTDPA